MVIELVSIEKDGEMAAGYAGYARFGVPCCVISDPLRLVQEEPARALQPAPAEAYRPCAYAILSRIGPGLPLWQGRFDNLHATCLRWLDASGELVPKGEERAGRAESGAGRLLALLRAHEISLDGGTTV